MKFSAICLICIAALLAGCARQPVVPGNVYRMQQMRHWYGLSHWRFEGRVGVVAGHDSFSGSIDWKHEPGRDSIDMAGPLGQGRVSLVVTEDRVEISDGEQSRVYREAADKFMLRQFGVDIPVRAFRFWLLGLVQPGIDYLESEMGFVQLGWRVTYRQLQEAGGAWLPRKIIVENNDNKLKLIVDRWELS